MKVLKFGGTSVGSADRIRAVAGLIDNGEPQIVVLSAMSGTTNTLVEISNCLYRNEKQAALHIIQNLEVNYYIVITELFETEAYIQKGKTFIQTIFTYLRSFINKDFYPLQEKAVLAQGEIMSTTLMHYYLEECGVSNTLLSALEYMRIDKDCEPDYFYIRQNLKRELAKPDTHPLIITQGFICRNAYGSIDNLERGGSDYTASLIGAAIQAEEIQIWTDIDGMHNNDPRFVNDTAPVRQLNFDEAAKLAHFGAKILHPTCILPAKEKNIPVRLLNALQPSASGTLISNTAEKGAIKAVAAKDNITYVKIKSLHMIPTPHFLSIVFDTFYNYNTPVDMVTTSDIGVSVTIDDDKHIDEIVGVLRKYATITVEKNMVIVCVVGDLEWQNVGFEARIINALKDIPVRMISYGGSSSNVSLVMKAEDKVHALKALSEHLFSVSDKPVLSSVS